MSDTNEGAAPGEGLVVDVDAPEVPAQEQQEDQAERQFSKRADKRINDLLGQRAQERTRREQAEARAQALEARLEALEKAAATATTEVHASRQADAARALREARAAGDTDAEIVAQQKLTEAMVEARTQRVAPEPPKPAAPRFSTAMQDWMGRNDWFETDDVMKTTALGFHQDAVRRGIKVETPEYFAHIDGKMRAAYPDRFDDGADGADDEAETPPVQRMASSAAAPRRNVAGGAPTANPARRIILSAEQLEAASFFKLTPQQYAAQIKGAAK